MWTWTVMLILVLTLSPGLANSSPTREDSLNGPWTEEKSQNWFQGGGGVQYVGQSGDLLKEGHYEQHLPVVGEHIDYNQYQPPWQKQFKKKYKPTFELSQKQSNRNVAYPEILLPTHQSLASFKSPQNTSKNDDDGLAPRQRHKNSWESRSRFQNEEAGYFDLLARQNYWDASFGSWPTHTVNPSNINILQEPQIPIGKLCPENWKYFQGSCYLLRNQELYPGELVTTLYKASWYTAKATCNALGGYLVEIESKEEQDFVWNIKKSKSVALLWTGATDFGQAGYWTWSQSKKPVEYHHWSPYPWTPDSLGPVGRGHCMALRGDGRWGSFRCPNKFPYLCERASAVFRPPLSSTTIRPQQYPGAGHGGDSCQSVSLQGPAWVKLSSSLMSHPPQGRCYVNIVFSTFSNGLLLRKFDWNDESITLSIMSGQLVLRMATGSGQDISLSSPYIVNDGLEHKLTLSTGVGLLSLQVDDDINRLVESAEQPGLAQDANVFVGGQPGGAYSGYRGCIESLRVLITSSKYETPDWSQAHQIDFKNDNGPTILYGNYECGVCNMRDGLEAEEEPSHQSTDWEVSELPRPITSIVSQVTTKVTSSQVTEVETNRGYSDMTTYDWTVASKPLLILDRKTSAPPTTASTEVTSTKSTTTTATTSTTSTIITTTSTTTIITTSTSTTTSSSTTSTSTSSISTTIGLIRRACNEREIYLSGGGWLEMSSKLLPHRQNMKTIIKIQFSSKQTNSLLLWQGNHLTNHYFAVALVNGFLEFRFNMGSVPAVIRSRDRVNSGTLHQAVIVREENTGSVQIDGGRRVTGTTRGGDIRMNVRRTPVYLGGAPRHSKYLPPAKLYKTPFKGCIHSMRVDNKKIIDDDSGLGGFGAEIDFTDNKLIKDRVNVKCMNQCFE